VRPVTSFPPKPGSSLRLTSSADCEEIGDTNVVANNLLLLPLEYDTVSRLIPSQSKPHQISTIIQSSIKTEKRRIVAENAMVAIEEVCVTPSVYF
jgi:hypothetical protein